MFLRLGLVVALSTTQLEAKRVNSARSAGRQPACPEVQPRSYRKCFDSSTDCVYVPKSNYKLLDELPTLQQAAGTCVSQADLLREAPVGVELLETMPEVDALELVRSSSKEDSRWVRLSEFCGQDQSWNSSSCAKLCDLTLSWSMCIRQHGCVYVYRNNTVANVPASHHDALRPAFGQCVAANGLIGSSPVGTIWKSDKVDDIKQKGLKVKAEDNSIMTLVFPPSPKPPHGDPDGTQPEGPHCVEGNEAEPVLPLSLWPSTASHVEHWLQSCHCTYWLNVAELGSVLQVRTDYAFVKQSPAEFLQVEYGCWRNVLSKTLRMPVQFEYIASADTANYGRSHKFSLDETGDLLEWQPPKWSKSDKYGAPYDVGHLVMANHFDGNKELIAATNLMTNVLPQLGDMNRFAWLATEMLTECAREGSDAENVFVIGGCVWPEAPDHIKGNTVSEKMLKVNYKLLIPDYCWKVIAAPERGHVAFYMPNTVEARISKKTGLGPGGVQQGLEELNQFVVSVAELEDHLSKRQTPQKFQIGPEEDEELRQYKPTASQMFAAGWSLSCDMK